MNGWESLSRYGYALVQPVLIGPSIGSDGLLASANISPRGGGWWRAECGLDIVLLVGTEPAQAAYYGGPPIRLCRALYLYGLIL
jgi:hypothetical protein